MNIKSDLFNPLITPPGLRCCFWDARYIASQPFCLSSNLTDKEAKELAEFEEQKFWERNEALKQELYQEILNDSSCDEYLDLQPEVVVFDLIKVVDLFKTAPKKFYFVGYAKNRKSLDSITSKLAAEFFRSKSLQAADLRQSFLTR